MPLLINLKTNLKSLKYGGDRPGKGNSGQPFIQSKIPDSSFLGTISGPDSIFRGGISGAAKSSIIDVNRLKLWFQQPVNSLFIDKQNLLSRTAAPAQGGTKQAPKLLNEGIYTPLSTLAQAGVISIGGHLNKQGINPFAGIGSPYTPSLYLDKVKESNQIDNYKDNRLYNLYETHITKKSLSPNIISYSGGPGSILGVGKTNIKFADQRTGKNNPYSISGATTWTPNQTSRNSTDNLKRLRLQIPTSRKFNLLLPSSNSNIFLSNLTPPSVYKQGPNQTILNNNDEILYANGSITYNQTQIISQSAQSKTNFGSPSLQDFREELLKQTNAEYKYIMSTAPPYATKNIDSPDYIGMDSAGKRGDKKSYTNGKILEGEQVSNVIDKITSLGVQSSSENPKITSDLCLFFIEFINTGIDPKNGFINKFIQFRAYLDNISDSYNPNWNSFKYPGRADSFYTYEGFDRKLTLGWSIVALSKGELEPMYEKLNYLASATTAEYSEYGYMKGVLTKLTIGSYISKLPGFINSLTYDISTDTTWEIGIDDTGSFDRSFTKKDSKGETIKDSKGETIYKRTGLPHMIKVTMGYTPIPNQLARFEIESTSTPRFVNM